MARRNWAALRLKIQMFCKTLAARRILFAFRIPQRKWKSLALKKLQEMKSQLADEEMMNNIKCIEEWRVKTPSYKGGTVHRKYGEFALSPRDGVT